MLVKERLTGQPQTVPLRRPRSRTGGGGGGRGGNLGYFGGKGGSGGYERSMQQASTILGPKHNLLNEFKKRVGVGDPFNVGLITPEQAGRAKTFGDETVKDYVQNMKEYSAGLKKTFAGDVALKGDMVENAKEFNASLLEQHGLDIDYLKDSMNTVVGMAANNKDLQWHMRKCQGQLEELANQAGGRF